MLEDLPVQRVGPIEYLKDTQSTMVTVTSTSQTLASLLGSALPAGARAVTLVVGDQACYYNPVGTASAANASLPTVFTIYGSKTVLDLVELYAATNIDVGLIVHEPVEVLPS